MRKFFHTIAATIVLVILIVFIYFNRDSYITAQTWKYRDGAHIGDWVEFNKGPASLESGTIYLKGVKFAHVQCCIGQLLIIYSPTLNMYGSYINKK